MYVLVCDLDGDGDLDFVSVEGQSGHGSGIGSRNFLPAQSPYAIVYYENVGDASNPNFIQHREKELNPFYNILQHGATEGFSQHGNAQLVDIDGDGKFCCSVLIFSIIDKINWKNN